MNVIKQYHHMARRHAFFFIYCLIFLFHIQVIPPFMQQQAFAEEKEDNSSSFFSFKLCFNKKQNLQPRSSMYVLSLMDFKLHMSLHRKRLLPLSRALIALHPEIFTEITPEMAEDFLTSNHDISKVDDQLSKNLSGGPISEQLFQFYGRHPKCLSQVEIENLSRIVMQLNSIDYRRAMHWMRDHGQLTAEGEWTHAGKQLLRLEKIVDTVDRGQDEVSSREEFGRPIQKASTFLVDPVDKKLAQELELYYADLVKNLEYSKNKVYMLKFNNRSQLHVCSNLLLNKMFESL